MTLPFKCILGQLLNKTYKVVKIVKIDSLLRLMVVNMAPCSKVQQRRLNLITSSTATSEKTVVSFPETVRFKNLNDSQKCGLKYKNALPNNKINQTEAPQSDPSAKRDLLDTNLRPVPPQCRPQRRAASTPTERQTLRQGPHQPNCR